MAQPKSSAEKQAEKNKRMPEVDKHLEESHLKNLEETRKELEKTKLVLMF